MPLQFTRVHLDREDGTYVEVVFACIALRVAKLFGPWLGVAGANVDQIGFRIIRDTIPNGSSAACFPPLAFPSPGGGSHSGIFERFGWVAGHGGALPCQTPGERIVR